MSDTLIIRGISETHDIDCEIARKWVRARLEDVPYLYGWMLRALIKDRDRYRSVRTDAMSENDFLHGVYLGLCDHFNDGFDIEDMTTETRELLNI